MMDVRLGALKGRRNRRLEENGKRTSKFVFFIQCNRRKESDLF
jgi:hypothetical protein